MAAATGVPPLRQRKGVFSFNHVLRLPSPFNVANDLDDEDENVKKLAAATAPDAPTAIAVRFDEPINGNPRGTASAGVWS